MPNTARPVLACLAAAWLALAWVSPCSADTGQPRWVGPQGIKPKVVEGIRGKGVMVSNRLAVPVYDLPADAPTRQGTIEFWFQPHDWDNRMTYDLNGPKYLVPLIRAVGQVKGDDGTTTDATLFRLAAFRMSETKSGGLWIRSAVQPGQWTHVLVVWKGRTVQVFVNGEEADSWVYRLQVNHQIDLGTPLRRIEFGGTGWSREFAGTGGYDGSATIVDELRYYGRALTPIEIRNAYKRYVPGATLEPLPFAYATVDMNAHSHQVVAEAELLGPKRDSVTATHLKLTNEVGDVLFDDAMPDLVDARTRIAFTHDQANYGRYTATFTFRDAQGDTVDTQTVDIDRPKPAWVDNTLGLHPGKVLPGWAPMKRDGNAITLTEKQIVFDGRGWPARLAATGKDVVDQPVRITLESGAEPIDLRAAGDSVAILEERDDLITTRGVASADGWSLTTQTTTEFDGFMLIEATLDGPRNATVSKLSIEFPMTLADEQFVGYWAGYRWFRGSCDYRRLPADDGVVFSSNKSNRQRPDGWKGKVSFMPMLSIADDWRGLHFLAENDRNWSQGWEQPAQEIVREGGRTTLRLNLVHEGEPKAITGPRTYTFAIQTMPVRPVPSDARAKVERMNFGKVDGFNGNTITSLFGGHMDFRLGPEDGDWSIVAQKAPQAISTARGDLHMYLDRTWQRAPHDAVEYRGDWRGWGGATRYTKPVRDAHAWYVNEYLKRGHIQGVYIDDCWTKPTKLTRHGPAYRKENGEAEWGFEFFAWRDVLKRMRWLFHDNNIEPSIWVHITQTLYYPVFSFVDVMCEGEDRYVPWGANRNFITSWGMDRVRYSNVRKSGLPTAWMNAIGNKMQPRGPMPKWHYRQQRAYIGACAAADVWTVSDDCGALRRDLVALGCADDATQFVGYWEPGNPAKPAADGVLASAYRTKRHIALVVLNKSANELVPEIAIDQAVIREWLGGSDASELVIEDADSTSMPQGDDIQDFIAQAADMDKPEVNTDETDPLMAEVLEELDEAVAEDQRLEDDPLARFGEHNLEYDGGTLQLRVRAHDYRLLKITLRGGAQ